MTSGICLTEIARCVFGGILGGFAFGKERKLYLAVPGQMQTGVVHPASAMRLTATAWLGKEVSP